MAIHDSHKMDHTAYGTHECANCWSCSCHETELLAMPCEKKNLWWED